MFYVELLGKNRFLKDSAVTSQKLKYCNIYFIIIRDDEEDEQSCTGDQLVLEDDFLRLNLFGNFLKEFGNYFLGFFEVLPFFRIFF